VTFTDQDKLEAVERELRMRVRVYERRVADGKMSQQKANHEIAVLRAIVADYQARVAQGQLL
jgi:hypothetical protein